MAGNDPLADIMAACVAVETALVPPAISSASQTVYEDLVVEPYNFPAFVNVPRHTRKTYSTGGVRDFEHTIDILLLFSVGDYAYASVAQRAWVPVVLDAFDETVKLSGGVQLQDISEIDFDPVVINEQPYVAITFTLKAITSGAFAFS